MKIHERIKQLQADRNWSTNHMATEADISPATVNGWFKKRAMPTIEGIQKLCTAFGITVSEFFNEAGAPPTYLTDSQQELLDEYNLLDAREKDDILRMIRTRNEIRKNSNPL